MIVGRWLKSEIEIFLRPMPFSEQDNEARSLCHTPRPINQQIPNYIPPLRSSWAMWFIP